MTMTPKQFEQIQGVFERLQWLSRSDREAELAKESEFVRTEVVSLLAAYQQCGEFLESKSTDRENSPETEIRPNRQVAAPQQMGNYRLLQLIGEGGHGTVYMAEQTSPIVRKVAVKLIKPGMDSKQVLARFHAERQALAMMDHPSIARVIDAGQSESGSPYFVMELVKGISIHDFCQQNQLSLDQRLRLFRQVCLGVHHAHQKGVIHRDLKPANVLVTMRESEPLAKIIDFGIAKALDTRLSQQSLFTEYGQMIGTLEYMSPEQAEMTALDIDTRSDVYSLGVLLYQLLTGEPPISRDDLLRNGLFEIPRMLRETEPITPSARLISRHPQISPIKSDTRHGGLSKLPSGDLDWIAMKALAKDRRRRYDSALDFARDLERFLQGEAVEAHPPSLFYKVAKLARRNRTAVAMGLLIAASLLVGLVGLSQGLRRANLALTQAKLDRVTAIDARQEADESAHKLTTSMYADMVQLAWRAAKQHNRERARELLAACLPEQRGWEWSLVESHVGDQRHSILRAAGQSAIISIDMKIDEKEPCAACLLDDGRVEIRSLINDTLLATVREKSPVSAAKFSPNGKLVLATEKGVLSLYRARDWTRTNSQQLGLGRIYDLSISNESGLVAVCTGGAWAAVYDLQSLESQFQWELPSRVANIAFRPGDDKRLIAAGLDGNVYWMEIGVEKIASKFASEANLHQIAWKGDRPIVLSAGKAIDMGATESDAALSEVIRCQGVATALAINSDGVVAVGSGDGQLRLRCPGSTQQNVAKFGSSITAIAPSRDSQFVVALSDGRMLRVNAGERKYGWSTAADASVTDGILLPQSKIFVVAYDDGWLRAFDIETGELQREIQAHQHSIWSLSCDQTGGVLATVGEDQRLRCWETADLKLRFEQPIDWGVRDVCVAPDASWVASAPPVDGEYGRQEGTIAIWNAKSGKLIRLQEGHHNWVLKMAVCSDGSQLASTSENRTTRVWNMATGDSISVISPANKSSADHLAFDASGKNLYVGHRDGWISSWEARTGMAGKSWAAFGDAVTGLAVTADDRVVATSRSSDQLRVHDFVTNSNVGEFDLGFGYLTGFRLSSDSQYLSVVGPDRRATTWKLAY